MTNELLGKRVADLTMADLYVMEHALNGSPALPPAITFGVAFGYIEPEPDDAGQPPLTHAIEESDESYEASEALLKVSGTWVDTGIRLDRKELPK